MRWCEVLTACSVLVGSLGGCLAADDLQPFDASRVSLLQMEPLMEGEDIAVLSTSDGEIRLRFFPSEAPDAVRNFIALANEGFYNGRAIYPADGYLKGGGSVLLSGSKEPDGTGGASRVNGGRPFKKEISANLWHFPGAVSVLGNKSFKGDSRFFITGSRTVPEELIDEMVSAGYPQAVVDLFRERGGMPEYSLEYSVFAQVVQGQDVVDALISRLSQGEEGLVIQSVQMQIYQNESGVE